MPAASEQKEKYLKIQDIHSSELAYRKKFDLGKKINRKIEMIKKPLNSELERLKDLNMDNNFINIFIEKCKKNFLFPNCYSFYL